MLSLTVPGLQADIDAPAARDDARFANDYLAKVVAGHPDRFRGFAALPMQDPQAAAAELGRCVRELGFCGALVNDHLQGHYLDDRSTMRCGRHWKNCPCRCTCILVRRPPITGRCSTAVPSCTAPTWSWAAETGGHALRIIYGGVFDRHPGATLIPGHMGEFLPFMRSRLDSRYLTLDPEVPLQRMPSAYIGSNVVITTSGVFSPAALTGASWRSAPTPSCSPSTTRTSPATKP